MIRLISNSDLNLKVIGALEHRVCVTGDWWNLVFVHRITLEYIYLSRYLKLERTDHRSLIKAHQQATAPLPITFSLLSSPYEQTSLSSFAFRIRFAAVHVRCSYG